MVLKVFKLCVCWKLKVKYMALVRRAAEFFVTAFLI